MLFVGYGAPASPSQTHHPSTSATVRTIRPLSISNDAIEADLRSLYSQALRLQNSKQHPAALALFRRILSHKCYHDQRTREDGHASQHGRHSRRGGEEEAVVEGADRGLEQLWRLTWRNVGDVYQSTGQHHIALHCYHTAIASHNSSALAGSATTAATLHPLLLSLAHCAVQVGQLSLARRTLEAALVGCAHEAAGSEWDVIDALVDVLYCIGDHHALAMLLETAVQRDGGYVKGLLLYSQLHAASLASLPLSATVYAHCQRQLQQVPRVHVRTVTRQLLQLMAAQRELTDQVSGTESSTQPPAVLHRTIPVSSASPLTSFATSLLALHNELTLSHKQQRKHLQTADTLSIHQLLKLMKEDSKHVNDSATSSRSAGSVDSAHWVDVAASTQSHATTTMNCSISTSSLSSPLILTLSTPTEAIVSQPDIDDQKVVESDAGVVVASDEYKREPAEDSRDKRLAAVRYAQVAVGDDAIVDETTLSFDHPSLLPLPSVPTSLHSQASSVRPTQPLPSSDTAIVLSSFVSQHASSAAGNNGCVDVMHRYLQWLHETSAAGVDSVTLARLVDVVWRYRLLPDDDVDELLYCAELVMDAQRSRPNSRSSLLASTLSSVIAQVSLVELSPTLTLSVAQRVRLCHIRAHHLLSNNEITVAVEQLQASIDLLSAHPQHSPVDLPHCQHLDPISFPSLHESIERLNASQLLHKVSQLAAAASHSAVVDAFMVAHTAEPSAFEHRFLALTEADQQQLMSIVLNAAEAEKSVDREWQVRRIEGRLGAAQLVMGKTLKEDVVETVRKWCERVLSLFATLSTSATPPRREEVLEMVRTLTVSLTLIVRPVGSSVDQLDVPLITAINKLSTYYSITVVAPLSSSSTLSSAFQLHLSLLATSHHLLARISGCRSSAGRAVLSSYLESLFLNRHLRLHEHHSVDALLPLLPPLPACFMPVAQSDPEPLAASSIAQPGAMVLSEASSLLSDLCDLFRTPPTLPTYRANHTVPHSRTTCYHHHYGASVCCTCWAVTY